MKKIERNELLLTVKIEFNENLENIMKVLEFGNSEEKIRILENLTETEGSPAGEVVFHPLAYIHAGPKTKELFPIQIRSACVLL